MPAPTPFLSIIIVCRNPGTRLQAALASVWVQQEANFETIVIDGGSTDGTREWLEDRRSHCGTLVCEPDKGIYEAMNKAVRLARGPWLLFMGADDILSDPQVLAQAQSFIGDATSGIFCGEARYSDGRVWRAPTNPVLLCRNFIHHQACFYHLSVFANCAYDETLSLQADYDLNLRLWLSGIRPQPLPIRIAVCASGGLSDRGDWKNYREEITVRHRHFPAWRCWLWDLGSVIRYLRKQLFAFAADLP